MNGPRVGIVGAGVIGCALAFELVRRGFDVSLLDRQPPARGGASYGNVGHIAAELVEPLPAPGLLLNFWRELTVFGGPLSLPVRRWLALAPWAWRFTRAAFKRPAHTALLAPLVRPAATDWEQLLAAAGRSDLLRRHGHYQFWSGADAAARAQAEAAHMADLGVPTALAAPELSARIGTAAGLPPGRGAALHFPDCAHVLDPTAVAQALVDAAQHSGRLRVLQRAVQAVRVAGATAQLETEGETLDFPAVVICAGAWSADLLKGFGLHVPLEAAFGYHMELPDVPALADGPILYDRERLLVTPMAGRLRASSFMAFSGLDAAPVPRHYARLEKLLRRVGYGVPPTAPRWCGPRPVLPDYLPALGQVPAAPVYYACGHQHIGLTLAPVTATLMADLLQGRTPRHDLRPFDLRRFD